MSKAVSILLLIFLFSSCGNTADKIEEKKSMADHLTGTNWMHDYHMGPINFRDSVFIFIAEKNMDTIHPMYDKFSFMKNGLLTYELYAPGSLFCMNGLLSLDSSYWRLKDNKIGLKLNGRYSMDYNFNYDIVYRIDSIDDSRMVLSKEKELEIKRHDPFDAK